MICRWNMKLWKMFSLFLSILMSLHKICKYCPQQTHMCLQGSPLKCLLYYHLQCLRFCHKVLSFNQRIPREDQRQRFLLAFHPALLDLPLRCRLIHHALLRENHHQESRLRSQQHFQQQNRRHIQQQNRQLVLQSSHFRNQL